MLEVQENRTRCEETFKRVLMREATTVIFFLKKLETYDMHCPIFKMLTFYEPEMQHSGPSLAA